VACLYYFVSNDLPQAAKIIAARLAAPRQCAS